MKLNVAKKPDPVYTHGGAIATAVDPETELRRTVMACMLWEDQFYESGMSIADRIKELVPKVRPEFAAACAYHARTRMHLRHVPLLIVREMARLPEHKKLVGRLLPDVIQRADEITEFLAIYWKDKRQPLSAQVKKGLAESFRRFTEYDFAKYDRDGKVKLRDALFLSHSKPADAKNGDRYTKEERRTERAGTHQGYDLSEGELLYQRIVDRKLATPDTWEVALSAAKDKTAEWRRLLSERKLGALAFLRNLRNMTQAGITNAELKKYGENLRTDRVLPFRFVAAARVMPQLEPMLEPLMLKCLEGQPKLPGRTVLVIDVSGSMMARISGKSDMSRLDTAAALAILVRDMCETPVIYCTAGSDGMRIHNTQIVAPRRGFALRDAVLNAAEELGGGGIFLTQCMNYVQEQERNETVDRVIVLTDEQDTDTKLSSKLAPLIGKHNYIVNVASYKNGIGYDKWTKIDGWSEAVLDYIREYEREDDQ